MNWLINTLQKEARRFRSNDQVRYFSQGRKGKGNGIVLTPSFHKGRIVDFDQTAKRYRVKNDTDEEIMVHPRNLVPDSISRSPSPSEPSTSMPSNNMNSMPDIPM